MGGGGTGASRGLARESLANGTEKNERPAKLRGLLLSGNWNGTACTPHDPAASCEVRSAVGNEAFLGRYPAPGTSARSELLSSVGYGTSAPKKIRPRLVLFLLAHRQIVGHVSISRFVPPRDDRCDRRVIASPLPSAQLSCRRRYASDLDTDVVSKSNSKGQCRCFLAMDERR